jgi:tRNA U54 and U55 pseudouridine synthase Pus10
MSKLINVLNCENCGEEIGISLEMLTPAEAIKEIEEFNCWKCGSHKWRFTDLAEH